METHNQSAPPSARHERRRCNLQTMSSALAEDLARGQIVATRPATRRQGVILTETQHNRLDRVAKELECSKNQLIRTAIERLLADVEEDAA